MKDLLTDSGATFSEDRVYRYTLWRLWGPGKAVMFIGLNPSTADETEDDPTIRRCIGFARDWGYDGIYMGNLFAVRATDPKVMLSHPDPVGPENLKFLRETADKCDLVVAAWGNHGAHRGWDRHVRRLIPNMKCFGLTKTGQPKHPLYLRADSELVPLDGGAQ